MLTPLALSVRRLALRACTQTTVGHPAQLLAASLRTRQPLSVRSFGSSAALESTSPLENLLSNEQNKIVLEPIDALVDEVITSGFADQQPLSDFALSDVTMRNLEKVGITHLFPVQTQSFDIMMQGAHIQGRSKTGSGKTLAFALPIVEKIIAKQHDGQRSRASKDPMALILLPTRELAQQVADEIGRIAPQLRTANIVGGVSYVTQERQLRRGVDIVVGTPGRITDLVNKNSLALDNVEIAVLDEADMMLKFGFQEAVETILGWIPREQMQCVMWSATFPKWVNAMARKFLQNPVSIDLVGHNDNHVPATVAHKAIHAPVRHRITLLESVLRHHSNNGQTLVFTETKQEADEIANALGGDVRALHGDLSQGMRSSTMEGFRNGSVKTLVCTDIAARGLDIANVELVVQFRLPSDKESFVHRAGRTGRAGRSGTNIVFFDRMDVGDVLDFEKRYKFQFRHAAPPAIEHMLDQAVEDIVTRLDQVPVNALGLFEDHAAKLMDARGGLNVVTAALALLAGFDSKNVNAVSMITGKHSMQTVELDGLSSTRQVHQLLLSVYGPQRLGRDLPIFHIDGKFVFDIPHDSIHQLREYVNDKMADDNITIAPAIELSRMLIEEKKSSFGSGSNGRHDRRNSGFGSQNRSNGRDGRRNRPSFDDFDAGFLRGNGRTSGKGGARRNSNSKGFGRFSESRSASNNRLRNSW